MLVSDSSYFYITIGVPTTALPGQKKDILRLTVKDVMTADDVYVVYTTCYSNLVDTHYKNYGIYTPNSKKNKHNSIELDITKFQDNIPYYHSCGRSVTVMIPLPVGLPTDRFYLTKVYFYDHSLETEEEKSEPFRLNMRLADSIEMSNTLINNTISLLDFDIKNTLVPFNNLYVDLHQEFGSEFVIPFNYLQCTVSVTNPKPQDEKYFSVYSINYVSTLSSINIVFNDTLPISSTVKFKCPINSQIVINRSITLIPEIITFFSKSYDGNNAVMTANMPMSDNSFQRLLFAVVTTLGSLLMIIGIMIGKYYQKKKSKESELGQLKLKHGETTSSYIRVV